MPAVLKSVDLPNRVTLCYVEQGDLAAMPLVLLHAIGDSWKSFEPVLEHLPASVHALALSQRGHGDSARPASGYQTRDFAADLRAFLDATGLEQAVIVGGSSGGLAGRRFAIDYPERTLGLVLLGSPASLKDKPLLLETWGTTVSELTDPTDDFVHAFVEATARTHRVPAAFLETVMQESLKVPAHVWKQTYLGLLEDDSEDELHSIAAPTLVVWGDQDSLLPRSDQERLTAAIPASRLIVYEGGGHPFYWEEPERVARDLVAFLKGPVGSRRG